MSYATRKKNVTASTVGMYTRELRTAVLHVPTRAEMETVAVNALVRDTKFAPTDIDRMTTARAIVKTIFDALAKAGAL